MSRRIFVPLKSEPFWKFWHKTKTVEIRARDSPVARAVLNHDQGTPVLLRRGYNTLDEMIGELGLFVLADCLEALPLEFRIAANLSGVNLDYYDDSKPVLAFQVLNLCRNQDEGAHGGR